jgi:predicted nucleic acid-binding protein
MILIDTCVWVDHFRSADSRLSLLVTEGSVWQHPFVTGELAVGNFRKRDRTLLLLRSLPQVAAVGEDRFLGTLDELGLAGSGLGFVDVHLLAAMVTMPGLRLWTTDCRLAEQAERLGAHFAPP